MGDFVEGLSGSAVWESPIPADPAGQVGAPEVPISSGSVVDRLLASQVAKNGWVERGPGLEQPRGGFAEYLDLHAATELDEPS